MGHEYVIAARAVTPVAFGAMPLSLEGRPDRETAFDVVRAALERGIQVVDTADAYGRDASETGHNERLVAGALRACGDLARDALVTTKGGHYRDAAGTWLLDGSPAHLTSACEASLRALGVDAIWLYQLHRPDPAVPFAESVGALRDLLDAGKVRSAGVSNVSVAQVDTAREVLGGYGVASVQNRLSADEGDTYEVAEHCRRHGIAFMAYGVLGGRRRAKAFGERQPVVAAVAAELGVAPQVATVAWHVAGSYGVLPVVGCGRVSSAVALGEAARLALDPEQYGRLAAVLGPR